MRHNKRAMTLTVTYFIQFYYITQYCICWCDVSIPLHYKARHKQCKIVRRFETFVTYVYTKYFWG